MPKSLSDACGDALVYIPLPSRGGQFNAEASLDQHKVDRRQIRGAKITCPGFATSRPRDDWLWKGGGKEPHKSNLDH